MCCDMLTAFFWFDLDAYFTIDALKSRRAEFAASYAANPAQFLIVFTLLGIFPWIDKAAIGYFQRRKVDARRFGPRDCRE